MFLLHPYALFHCPHFEAAKRRYPTRPVDFTDEQKRAVDHFAKYIDPVKVGDLCL